MVEAEDARWRRELLAGWCTDGQMAQLRVKDEIGPDAASGR